MTPRGTDPITCGVCGNVSSLDECDCGGLPDAMVFCPACLAVIEVQTGAPVPDDDLEVWSGEA